MTRVNLNDGTTPPPLTTEERQHEIIRELVEERDKLRAQLRASEAEVARLYRELEDVRKLDAWAEHGEGPRKVTLRRAAPGMHARVTVLLDQPHRGPHVFAGATHAAARRAAVEYLEKESKDG